MNIDILESLLARRALEEDLRHYNSLQRHCCSIVVFAHRGVHDVAV